MILLTVEEIIQIHHILIERTGGESGIRNMNLLHSAVFSAEASFGGVEVYPGVEEKAARLAFAISKNHAFVDGNKRISILTMFQTLKMNHVSLKYTQADSIELGYKLADGSWDYNDVLAWIQRHKN